MLVGLGLPEMPVGMDGVYKALSRKYDTMTRVH
jgi:hypothetical protein